VNDSVIALNRLLAAGHDVWWIPGAVGVGSTSPGGATGTGVYYIPSGRGVRPMLEEMAGELGLSFTGLTDALSGRALRLRPVRIGLWDTYGGSISSGWIRFILDEFEFDYRLVFAPELDAGNLDDSFDVLIFPDGSIRGPGGRGGYRGDQDLSRYPEEYRDRVGSISAEATIPQIREFIENGGTVITEGSATSLGFHLELPIRDHLVKIDEEGNEQALRSQDYYVPGSILEVKLEHTTPLTDGMGSRVDVVFSRSPVFSLEPGAERLGVHRIGWFDTPDPLRSGWAWGQEYLENGTTLIEADIGDGKLFLFGPEVTFRAQPHGTFPLVFNAIYYGTAEEGRIR
jgi:hypothetical protein